MSAKENKWLIVRPDVILTAIIEPPIVKLEGWFEKYECRSYVTSGQRKPKNQFRIIQQAAIRYGLQKEFPQIFGANVDSRMVNGNLSVPVWLPVWSRLLTIGFLVNPPEPAKCMFDYIHPSKGKVPAGTLIKGSPHFAGTSFDIGGRGESEDQTINDELEVIEAAFDSGSIPGFVSYTIERTNNALHCDCKKPEG